MQYRANPRPVDGGELTAELVRNAAFVAHEGRKARDLSRWLDEDRGRRRVIYVFDTDTIVAHCAPWRTGPSDDLHLGRGYGQILPPKPLADVSATDRPAFLSSEKRRAAAVCWLLADKAFRHAGDQGIPILQMRSHLDETLRVYGRVKEKAKPEVAFRKTYEDRQDGVLLQALNFVQRNASAEHWPLKGNPGQFLSILLNRMETRDLQTGSRFVREWDGFVSLTRKHGLFELSEFAPDDAFGEEHGEIWADVRAQLSSRPSRDPEKPRYPAFRRVIAGERVRESRDRQDVDVEAFEVLAQANHLLRLGPGRDRLRVVLITGDRKAVLGLASSDARLSDDMPSMSHFAFDHVHHLWSFVDRLATESPIVRQDSAYPELFSGLLAFDADESSGRELNERLVSYSISSEPELAERIDPTEISEAYAKWDDFSHGAANLHRHFLVDTVRIKAVSAILIEKFRAHDPELSTRRIREMVVETMARARDRSNVEFSEIGANSILEAHRHGVRNPPDLMFDSLRLTDRIFKDLALPQRIFMRAGDFKKRFDEIANDCYLPSDPSDDDYREVCYVKYLVLGTLFASANRWLVAEQHAESAVRIVQRAAKLNDRIQTLLSNGEEITKISGREAWFLLAVARRVRATSAADFSRAADALKSAKKCLGSDQAAGTAAGVSPIRFQCEALALSLARYYQARKGDAGAHSSQEANEVFVECGELLRQLEASAHSPLGRLRLLPSSTRTTVATNVIQVAVIARYRHERGLAGIEKPPIAGAALGAALDVLANDTDLLARLAQHVGHHPQALPEAPEMICSPLMMLYAVVGGMLVDGAPLWHPRDDDDLDLAFNAQDPVLTSYDGWRFEALRSFAKTLIQKN